MTFRTYVECDGCAAAEPSADQPGREIPPGWVTQTVHGVPDNLTGTLQPTSHYHSVRCAAGALAELVDSGRDLYDAGVEDADPADGDEVLITDAWTHTDRVTALR